MHPLIRWQDTLRLSALLVQQCTPVSYTPDAGDQKRLIDFEVQTLGSSSVGFGGLQLLQTSPASVSAAQQAQPTPQQQLGGLFSWSGASPAAAPQQPQHTLNGGTPPPASAPQLGFTSPQSGAPFSGFSFSPGASTSGFVFGATSQQ